ncbi:MAG TPA: DUF5690 family protein [Fimbriiglobus sp.]|jgi:hypothetical protein
MTAVAARSGPSLRGLSVSSWSVVAAFGCYFCMYLFRKPFTAARFEDGTLWGVGLKTIFVIAQVAGYTTSKFIGIRVVAQVRPHRRVFMLLGLVGLAELALVLFAVTPPPYNAVWLIGNGLSLGMVYGMVLGFLEGRRHTEALTAGLCTSFIVAGGVAKSVGTELLEKGVSEYLMPAAAGLLFAAPFLFFVWMLSRIPPPSAADVAARTERVPMSATDRWAFFCRYAIGLTLLVLMFLLITILRSVRDDFAPEIWSGLHEKISPGLYARSETLVAVFVLLLNGSVVFVRNNRNAFFFAMAVAIGGVLLIAAALLALRAGVLSPFAFMVLHGLGVYLPYIAVHTTIFERLIAMTRDRGTIGYLMYLADSFGYLGYVVVLLTRNLTGFGTGDNFLGFFVGLSWGIVGLCLVSLIPCWWYFAVHPAARPTAVAEPVLLEVQP